MLPRRTAAAAFLFVPWQAAFPAIRPMGLRPSHGRGFTLFEFLVLLVIIAILAGVTMIKTASVASAGAVEQADKLRRDISHLQILSMSWGAALRLTASSTGYAVTCRSTTTSTPCTSVGATPIDPATGQAFSVTLTDSVTLSASLADLDFDSLGRPVSCSTSCTLLSANPVATYTLTGSTTTATVTVRPITGFAQRS
jgi:type II secretory pathway pseudopilin PulG